MRAVLPPADVSRIIEGMRALSPRAKNDLDRDTLLAWTFVVAMESGLLHHDALTPLARTQVERLAHAVAVEISFEEPTE